jgi:RNA polymerase sigma-70 factor, ECF subfamily
VPDAIERARAAWPQLVMSTETFAEHLAARVSGDDDVEAEAQRIHVEDLWLACACVRGVPGAAAAFEARHDADVRRGVAIAGLAAGAVDDLRQEVLQRLLVAREGEPPRLSAYAGHGPLGRWVSVVARRHALDAKRRRDDPSTAAASDDAALSAAYGDPELALMSTAQRDAFREALRRAAASLSARDRNLLRFHYVHQLGLDEIAGIHRVSRSTAGRRLARARTELVQRARDVLCELLGLRGQDLDREIANLRSAIDVTLRRVLGDPI